MPPSRARLPDHHKGLLLTSLGVLALTPDSLLVRLIDADPFTLLVWRGLLQALGVLAILAVLHRGRVAAPFRAVGRWGLVLAVVFAAGTVFFILALSLTAVADVLVIVAAAPLAAAVLSLVFLGEGVPLRTWIAISLTLVGIALLVSEDLGSGSLLGDLAAAACALCIGATFTITRHGRAVSMVPAMALAGLVTAAMALPFALLLEDGPWLFAGAQLGYTLAMGLVVVPVSFALITLGPRYLPAAEVGLLMLLETVLGPLWVWLVLGEHPGELALAGGALVVLTLAGHAATGGRRQPALTPGGP
ncbi:MAG: EamA family transporter [Kiloniellaceae bacterium]|nr:EamA family transporter [Kiloniellaceae bacterium]